MPFSVFSKLYVNKFFANSDISKNSTLSSRQTKIPLHRFVIAGACIIESRGLLGYRNIHYGRVYPLSPASGICFACFDNHTWITAQLHRTESLTAGVSDQVISHTPPRRLSVRLYSAFTILPMHDIIVPKHTFYKRMYTVLVFEN